MSAMPCVHVIRPIDYVPYAVPTHSFVLRSSSVVAGGCNGVGWDGMGRDGGPQLLSEGFRAPRRHSKKAA